MALLDPRQKDEEEQTTSVSSGGQAASAPVGGSETGNTSTSQQGKVADFDQINQQNTTRDFSALLNPVNAKVASGNTAVNKAWTDFQSQIGPDDPWDSSETNVLDNAIKTGSGLDSAKGILSRKYTGPTQMDTGWKSNLVDLDNDISSLSNPSGISVAMQKLNPTSSLGTNRFDALLASKDTNFRNSVQNAMNSVGTLKADADSKLTQSQKLAQGRAQQAADVQSKATSYLQDWRNNIGNQVSQAYQNAMQQYAQPTYNAGYGGLGINDAEASYLRNKGFGFTPQNYHEGRAPTRENVTSADQANQYNNIGRILGDNQTTGYGGSWDQPYYDWTEQQKQAATNLLNEKNDKGVSMRDTIARGRQLGYTGDWGNGGFTAWLNGTGLPGAADVPFAREPAGWTRSDVQQAIRGKTYGGSYLDWWNEHGQYGR